MMSTIHLCLLEHSGQRQIGMLICNTNKVVKYVKDREEFIPCLKMAACRLDIHRNWSWMLSSYSRRVSRCAAEPISI